MKKNLITVSFLSMLFLPGISYSQDKMPYSFDKKIELPGDGGYDYLNIDKVNRHLFVSHGTSVNIIDLNTEKPIGSVDGMKGVHGIAIVNEVNKGFITDGKDNAVVVFDLVTFKKIATVMLSGKKPDAVTYDPFSKKVFAFCGDSNNACAVDINTMKETNVIDLGGAPEFGVPDGKGFIYNNLEDKSSMVLIDTKDMKAVKTWPLAPCGGPTGLALDQVYQRAFTVCRENKGMSVVDVTNGKVVTTVPIGAGVDAVVYDEINKLIFCSNGDETLTVIQQQSADEYQVIQTLKTPYRAKTMAFDAVTGKIYTAVPQFQTGTKNSIAGTFAVWVYKKG